MQNSKKILWFTWKDRKNPLAGGAELVNEELAKRLVKDGKEVIFLVAGFKGGKREEKIDGYKIIRVGNKWTVYWLAYRYYKKYLQYWPDLVIEEINTIPFLTKYYVKQRNILLIYQLCRQIWFYEIFFPLNLFGYLIEPIYLWLLRDRKVITESESTKTDLTRFGFKPQNIKIIPIGIEFKPVDDLKKIEKYPNPTLISLGSIRAMKQTDHIIKAFELAKKEIPNLKLLIAGDMSGNYGLKIKKMIHDSQYTNSIHYLGKIDKNKKIEIMQKAHLLLVTSVKEGWCIVVTEANSQGTPAVTYNADGLRDSVKHDQTGLICIKNTIEKLSQNIVELFKDKQKYKKISTNAWLWSKEFNFDFSYKTFIAK
ncbi:glycosyltransferase family 4 protein [Patescibacteria group bacterium]|nr:glycosyltransferase family 4 protein [Patescibacteria group bacterium]MBU4016913.1 glycosyltransferase family 4 protein [Patescibacteria group bacterium]MBU4098878.1 glycosyltransferase family 4 protein [Patescibacteria group bacterium]